MPYIIEPLATHHNRDGFHCGEASLDQYIRRFARQDMRRRVARVFVITHKGSLETILGYYTLSATSLNRDNLPNEQARRLPRYPVPAAILGRLAVARQAQRQGIGRLLLADAVKRTVLASSAMAVYALVVDAVNEPAVRFYQGCGFVPFHDDSQRLFLPLASFEKHMG